MCYYWFAGINQALKTFLQALPGGMGQPTLTAAGKKLLQKSKALSLLHLGAGLGNRISTRESAGSVGAKSAGRLARDELAIAAHERTECHQQSPPFVRNHAPGRVSP